MQDSMSADVLLPEHFMPQEYASSAIVRELIESFEEVGASEIEYTFLGVTISKCKPSFSANNF